MNIFQNIYIGIIIIKKFKINSSKNKFLSFENITTCTIYYKNLVFKNIKYKRRRRRRNNYWFFKFILMVNLF